ncbi:MAG: alpha/beta hydrolase [Candidatus Micrarchaeota archaeon]
MEKLFFTSRGLKICGMLEIANPKSKEVVVMVHGYASGKDGSTYIVLGNELAKNNLNSFRFDLAGNGESEGKFEEQTISTMVEDIEAAVKMLQTRGFKVFDVVGSSGGGLASLVFALKFKLNKLALIAPVSDYPSQRRRKYGDEQLQQWKEKGYNFYDAGTRGLLKVNYSFFEDAKQYVMREKAAKIKCPVFIVHGDKDTDVTVKDSEELVKFLPNAELHVFKGAEHFFRNPGEKEELVKLIVDWLVT